MKVQHEQKMSNKGVTTVFFYVNRKHNPGIKFPTKNIVITV